MAAYYAVYLSAIVAANLSIAHFGVWISPINSFLLIGLDLALRDYMGTKLKWWQMLLLILITGIVSYALNPTVGQIAVASSTSFIIASASDWGAFVASKGSWLNRATKSNAVGAAIDSVLFPVIAFGAPLPSLVAAQFATKFMGATIWALIINRFVK